MHLKLKVGVLLLTLTGMSISAQAEGLKTAAIGTAPESVSEAPAHAAARIVDLPSAAEQSFQTGEVLVSLPSNLSPEVINALARRHRLTRMESQSAWLLGTTVHRWSIADGRSVPDVILALKLDGRIDAQPNYIYTLQ